MPGHSSAHRLNLRLRILLVDYLRHLLVDQPGHPGVEFHDPTPVVILVPLEAQRHLPLLPQSCGSRGVMSSLPLSPALDCNGFCVTSSSGKGILPSPCRVRCRHFCLGSFCDASVCSCGGGRALPGVQVPPLPVGALSASSGASGLAPRRAKLPAVVRVRYADPETIGPPQQLDSGGHLRPGQRLGTGSQERTGHGPRFGGALVRAQHVSAERRGRLSRQSPVVKLYLRQAAISARSFSSSGPCGPVRLRIDY